jgi:para-aminobenzoate synthetase component 1
MANTKRQAYLHSGGTSSLQRFDIFCANPVNSLSTITEAQAALTIQTDTIVPAELASLPFLGGWLGYASYECAAKQHIAAKEQNIKSARQRLPDFVAQYYEWAYVYDREIQQGFLIFTPKIERTARDTILRLFAEASEQENDSAWSAAINLNQLDWSRLTTVANYYTQYTKLNHYILNGDCYQTNLTHAFQCKTKLNKPVIQTTFFDQAETINSGFCAYLAINEDQDLLSFSPEQFISVKNGTLITKPIKGTVINNQQSADELINILATDKNKAENLMIVDLMRNDLSKVCELNSVKVDKLFNIESYTNVHHLVSTISGKLKKDTSPFDAFIECFPGGSITGAPKKRAMEIINELEESERGVYCGSVFYQSIHGNFDSNILIRTIARDRDTLTCWAGGGIVADSKVEDEYQESLDKVAFLTGIAHADN